MLAGDRLVRLTNDTDYLSVLLVCLCGRLNAYGAALQSNSTKRSDSSFLPDICEAAPGILHPVLGPPVLGRD